jgi:protein-S-isoprenylcysteine O-methyltransferase Ste14
VCAAALLSASWLILLAGLLVFLLLAIRTPIEEQKLIERFGEEYHSYMARTGRFVPRL